ncbi:hypothetical protein FJTKL_10103 [Diaporthe vaccinii]|uniref:Uncharacterized protein n=1 Tax=Diaporthe vaccinii TaxID=105482 RepID=A0ABR4ELA0_9PEZI
MKRTGVIVEPHLDPPSPLPQGITVRTPPPIPSSPNPHMSFNTSQLRDRSATSTQPQGRLLSSECSIIRKGNTYFGGGEMFIQKSHLLEPSPANPFPSNCPLLSDCLKAQMMLHLPGVPIWNFSNTLVEMADLALPSQKSACETWNWNSK